MKRYYNSKVAYYIHGQYDLLMEEGNWRNQINQLNLNGGCNCGWPFSNSTNHSAILFENGNCCWFLLCWRPLPPIPEYENFNFQWRNGGWVGWSELCCFVFGWVKGGSPPLAPPKRRQTTTTTHNSNSTKQLSISGMKLAEWRQFSLWNQLIDETKECRQWS